VNLKFIKLFEEFNKDAHSADSVDTWTDVRDIIQTKRPFVIITFKNKDNYLDAIQSDLKEVDKLNQVATINTENGSTSYPSLFISGQFAIDFGNKVKEFYSKYKIKQLIIGKPNSDYSTVYFSDGTSSDFGNEIVSTIDQNEFTNEDYFKIGSTYYKFIEFLG
jgi:hypothetical protein